MASQWLRWNSTTHIFELSTDNGINWGQLPLDASILTEGSIPDSILSSNVVLKNASNVMTNLIPLSLESTAPRIQWKETDGDVDAKYWRTVIDGGNFIIQSLNDALSASTNLIYWNRSGKITSNFIGAGSHDFVSNANSQNLFQTRNDNAGSSAYSGFSTINDAGKSIAMMVASSGGGSRALLDVGAPYLNIRALDAAGYISLHTGGPTARMLIDSAGMTTFTKPGDASTIKLVREIAPVSGSVQGGILFSATGMKNFGVSMTPISSGGSRAYMGWGTDQSIQNFTKNVFFVDSVVLANTATFQSPAMAACLMVITTTNENRGAIFMLCASGSTSAEVSDPTNGFSSVLGTSGMVNVSYSGGGIWSIQNLRGSSVTIMLTMIGFGT